MSAQLSFWSFFSRFGPMSDFFVSQKVFSRQNSMLLAWLEVISHYQLSSPVHWYKCHIFKIKMNINIDMSIFWDFSLTSMLKRSTSFSNFNRTMEPDQSILIQRPISCGSYSLSKVCLQYRKQFRNIQWK